MKTGEVYQSPDGVLVEVLQAREGCTLTCCSAAMNALPEKTADAKTEKHVPVITPVPGGYKVTVGSVPHPMAADHWIQWIELRAGAKVYREFLAPGQPPEATFLVAATASASPAAAPAVSAREFCNKHGLWKS